jgi:hypothetical protein
MAEIFQFSSVPDRQTTTDNRHMNRRKAGKTIVRCDLPIATDKKPKKLGYEKNERKNLARKKQKRKQKNEAKKKMKKKTWLGKKEEKNIKTKKKTKKTRLGKKRRKKTKKIG